MLLCLLLSSPSYGCAPVLDCTTVYSAEANPCSGCSFGATLCQAFCPTGTGGYHGIAMHVIHRAGNKLVEYTDRTAAEVDEMIKERQERNKVLREP